MRLEMLALEQLKERVATEYGQSTIGDLEMMIADSRRAVEASPLFTSAVVRKTGTHYHQIEIECQLVDPRTLPPAIVDEITRIWLDELRYDDFEAHAVAVDDRTVMLDFLTVARAPHVYATGMIVVSRA